MFDSRSPLIEDGGNNIPSSNSHQWQIVDLQLLPIVTVMLLVSLLVSLVSPLALSPFLNGYMILYERTEATLEMHWSQE